MWPRSPGVFWGALLVFLGALFLLANTGVLNNLNWDVVWPLLLIALGLWLFLGRVGPGGRGAVVDGSEPRDGIGRAKLDIAIGSGAIDVRSASLGDQLYQAHLEYPGPAPEMKLDRASGTLRISQRWDWFRGMGRVRIDAQLSDAIPWEVVCSSGEITGRFDLSSARLAGFVCRTGASRIELNLPLPTGSVPLRIDGGGLTISVVRPSGTAIKVHASAGAVSLHADGSRQDGVGTREWRSSGFEAAADRYEMTVSAGAVNLTLEQK